MIIAIISLIVLLILGLSYWLIYNKLVAARNVVEEAFSGIDVQLKKRFELIPNLVEAVKGYNAHEAHVLEQIVSNRSGGNSIGEIADRDASITNQLKQFRVQVEAYPELKANTQFLKLMENLSEVENELAMARRYYNGATRDFNTAIEVFPNSIVAGLSKTEKIAFYRLPEGEDLTPQIDLSK